MMRTLPLLSVAVGLMLLAACGQSTEDRRNAALAAETQIAPGIYGDLTTDLDDRGLSGVELSLDQGSATVAAAFVRCTSGCGPVEYVTVRRGLGGISFTAAANTAFGGQGSGGPVLVTVQPAGRDAVMLGADWGRGFEQRRLARRERPLGLDTTGLASTGPAVVIPRP